MWYFCALSALFIHFNHLLLHLLKRLFLQKKKHVAEYKSTFALFYHELFFSFFETYFVGLGLRHEGKINVLTHFCQICMSFFHFWPQGAHLGNLLLLAPGSALICQDWGEDMGEDIPCPQTVSARMFFQSAMVRLMQYFIFHPINPLLK